MDKVVKRLLLDSNSGSYHLDNWSMRLQEFKVFCLNEIDDDFRIVIVKKDRDEADWETYFIEERIAFGGKEYWIPVRYAELPELDYNKYNLDMIITVGSSDMAELLLKEYRRVKDGNSD